ncbi:MAG TPA: cupin domain-containing protein [Bryobacteraceae bacterium]|nr:cupin domain-containing protein [Bryobacteraceae bacterium]HOL71196.1 cupin domain-containing protein [Bryobacteraceae bacterium]HOQ47342.1 cupin domain-containing protein [Bryobacteraceae bacterium]HPQ14008.1 cupin domain-containing protein [Bryobacteraceae bacterium]HPU73873.1 cupin domain-containing protein [Bryobacteraceae bacterium]
MTDQYKFIQDIREQARVPENGILSQTIHGDDKTRIILFGFAAGQELTAHTAPYPATLTFLKGEASLQLGSDQREASEGTFVYMAPYLEHGIKAKTDVVMLLTMIKQREAK